MIDSLHLFFIYLRSMDCREKEGCLLICSAVCVHITDVLDINCLGCALQT